MQQATRIALLALSFAMAPASVFGSDVPLDGKILITAAASTPHDVVAADVDGDGDLDAISASAGSDTVAWHENLLGDGTLWTEHVVTTNANAVHSVAAADVDGDGDIDVLSASEIDDKIAWFDNLAGDGSAWAETIIGVAANGAFSVFAADVDGDGDLDALSASAADDKIAWYNNLFGDGTAWGERAISTGPNAPFAVHAADLDSDGDIDVLSASGFDDAIFWFENNFGLGLDWSAHLISGFVDNAHDVLAADIDGDGDLDVVSGSANDNKVAWHENTQGDASSWAEHVVHTDAVFAQAVAAADLDADGDMDLLSAASGNDQIAWYENRNGVGTNWTPRVINPAADGAWSVFVADADQDGDADVMSALAGDSAVVWHENATIHRSAFFPRATAISLAAPAPRAVHAADLDGDGDLEALAAFGDRVAWYDNRLGETSMDFGNPAFVTVNTVLAQAIDTGDVDGDGDRDVVSASAGDDKIAWHENVGISVPTFVSHVIVDENSGVDAALGARAVVLFDADSDGDLDVASASAVDHTIAVHLNVNGDGTDWSRHVADATALGAAAIAAADLDQDGVADLVHAGVGVDGRSGAVEWQRNIFGGGAVWNRELISDSVVAPRSVVVTDFDLDGDPDVISASGTDTPRVVWHENVSGDARNWVDRDIVAGCNGMAVTAADIDQDGVADVVCTEADAVSIFVADLDRDGDPDRLVAGGTVGDIEWHENRGGQFGWATTDSAPAAIFPGDLDDLLAIAVVHNGRSGDPALELARVSALMEGGDGDPLEAAELEALLLRLSVHADGNGDAAFDIAADPAVGGMDDFTGVADGVVDIVLSDFDVNSNVEVAQGVSQTFFLVAHLRPTAGTDQAVESLRVVHLPGGGQAEDRDTDIPLLAEFAPDAPSSAVTVPLAPGAVPDGARVPGPPLTLGKLPGGDLSLGWGASCHASDTDYAIYEGQLGDFASHQILQCSTGGAVSEAIAPGSGSAYYLVVPTQPAAEGSYGSDSNGAERAPAPTPCRPQVVGVCSLS